LNSSKTAIVSATPFSYNFDNRLYYHQESVLVLKYQQYNLVKTTSPILLYLTRVNLQ
jgi:hypothetical protein